MVDSLNRLRIKDDRNGCSMKKEHSEEVKEGENWSELQGQAETE